MPFISTAFIMENRFTGRHTALPSSDKSGPEKVRSQRRRQNTRDGILFQERIELGNKLREKAESNEGTVQRPKWAGGKECIAVAAYEDYPLTHSLLARIGIGVDSLHCRIRNAIEEAEARVKV